jgi:hypothetical protein
MNIWSKIVQVNIGRVERYGRILVGFGLLGMGLFLSTLWGLLGLYPLVTGAFGTEPLYALFGIKTTPKIAPSKPPRPMPPFGDAPRRTPEHSKRSTM